MKDLSRTMDITQQQMQEEEEEAAAVEAAKKASMADAAAASGKAAEASSSTAKPATAVDEPPPPYVAGEKAAEKTSAHTPSTATPPEKSGSPYASGTSTPRRGIPMRPALMDRSEEDAALDANLTEEEKELRKKEKKKAGLTKEQREELLAYEKERKRIRDERVETLSKKLVDRISIWTETDKGADVTAAFQTKTQLEVENLKMESFGLDILHAIGTTYLQKASSFLKSQKFLGISGFFSRLKDKGTLARETWTTISTAIDAQMTMEEMAKMEEKGGEDWTDEKKAEYEQRVTGKVLAAAWRGSKFEIQSVLRDVCDKVLNDKDVSLNKRIERAHALMISGEIYNKVRTPYPSSSPSPGFVELRLTAHRPRPTATPTKKASSWLSRSSWPTPPRSGVKTRTRRPKTKTPRRRRRRTRSQAKEATSSATTTTTAPPVPRRRTRKRPRGRTHDYKARRHVNLTTGAPKP